MILRQYLRFVVVGALAIGTYLVLFEGARLIPGLPLWIATAGSYLLATGLNYWLNYHWSFASEPSHTAALPRYGIIALSSVSLNAVTVPFLVGRGVQPAVAGFAFAILWPIVSFFAQKNWAFKQPE